jgi:putative PIN family toxin of toxin-antitoxin system
VTERPWRVVLDTNVFVSAALSKNLTSPTRELLDRWERGEFVLLMCDALNDELIEKLLERGVHPTAIALLSASLLQLADWVDIPAEAVTPVLADPDDDVVLACAVLGQATHVVTYDPHFDVLGGEYRGIQVVKALPFLWAVRED